MLKIPRSVFKKNLCYFCWFQNGTSINERFPLLKQSQLKFCWKICRKKQPFIFCLFEESPQTFVLENVLNKRVLSWIIKSYNYNSGICFTQPSVPLSPHGSHPLVLTPSIIFFLWWFFLYLCFAFLRLWWSSHSIKQHCCGEVRSRELFANLEDLFCYLTKNRMYTL